VSITVIDRPIWRRFVPRFLDRAAAHVRAGGHAAVVYPKHIDLVLTVGSDGKITELGLWSLLAIEQRRYRIARAGPVRGLATARVNRDHEGSVLEWCERDAVHPSATRSMPLDCLACAACCCDANVVVDERDRASWRAERRDDLDGYLRRVDGRVVMRMQPDGRCSHLSRSNRCKIYSLRPSNCRAFPIGSEACLAAREDTLGYRDG
jgi:hypothetical protein